MSVSVLYYKVTPEQINSAQLSELITHWMKGLTTEKQQKIAKLHFAKDKLLSLAGLQLLKVGMTDFSRTPFSLQQLHFPAQGKPTLEGDRADIDFNISHSGDIACCAISDNMKIGIDIEQHRKVNPNMIQKYFKTETTDSVETMRSDFFQFWTKNEAIIKAANHGSVFNIHDIQLEDGGGHYQNAFWYTYELDIPSKQEKEYTCHIACSDKIQNIESISSKQIFQL